MLFVPSKELKKEYYAKGCFYNLEINNKVMKCRSYLDIYHKDFSIGTGCPDVYAFMMNPGNSKPVLKKNEKESEKVNTYSLNSRDLASEIKNTLTCDAKPDNTKYQIMRLMKYYNWKYARVMNLSDIRNTRSKEFIKEYKSLKNSIHSVFLEKREAEREFLTNGIEGRPVIVAWGVNSDLKDLAVAAIKKLPHGVIGIQGTKNYLYFHPLPRGEPLGI